MGLSFSLLLVPQFGVMGLLFTYLIAGIPSTLLALWWIKKHYDASIDWGASAKIVLASVVTALIMEHRERLHRGPVAVQESLLRSNPLPRHPHRH